MPHLFTHKLILGADAPFHYNRFYDAAQQIKYGDFHYFPSLYGFQQSGRIVNAVYGPFLAYLQGLIVLLAGSWFHYQILSNFILYLISGFSMLILLRYVNIRNWVSVPVAVLFMSTYSIQYWSINQGFTSWGTCFYPLCMIPIADFVLHKKFPVIKVAVSVGLMTQIHLLSSIMLALMYIPFYLYYFFNQTEKGKALLQLIKSVLLYFVLTANIWAGLAIVYSGNKILPPFVNREMSQKAIDLDGSYWLHYPKAFPILILSGFLLFIFFQQKNTLFQKIVLYTSLVFFFLSTSLIPWTTLIEKNVPFISLIQFPFRFFVPFTLLLLLYLALSLNQWSEQKWFRLLSIFGILIFSAQTIQNLYQHLEKWENETFVSRHTYLFDTPEEARKTFFSKDMSTSLFVFQKTTPDYLPIYKETKDNKYDRYNEEILENETTFIKTHPGGLLTIKWKNTGDKTVHIPVIVYDRTVLQQNGKTLTDYEVTDIGTPIVKQQKGINELTLHYQTPIYFYFILSLTLIGWFTLLCLFIYHRYKHLRA
ncbi:membrane protein [Enterococcus faecium]|nr:membrane protein [Enterococcus faecium]